MRYWRCAAAWAKRNTKLFTFSKAIAPMLIALIQSWLLGLRPAKQTLTIVGTILLVYATLYGLEYLWKLVVQAPAAIYAEQGERIRELESIVRSGHPSVLFQTIQNLLRESPESKDLLLYLLVNGEMTYNRFCGMPGATAVHQARIMTLREYEKPRSGPRPQPTVSISALYAPVIRAILYGQEFSPGGSSVCSVCAETKTGVGVEPIVQEMPSPVPNQMGLAPRSSERQKGA